MADILADLNADFDDSIEVTEYNNGLGYEFTAPSSPNFRGNRYAVYLPQIPYLKDVTKMITVVSKTDSAYSLARIEGKQPEDGEFRTVDADNSEIRLVPHRLEFNAAQAGQTFIAYFWCYGSIYTLGLLTKGHGSSVNADLLDGMELTGIQALINKKIGDDQLSETTTYELNENQASFTQAQLLEKAKAYCVTNIYKQKYGVFELKIILEAPFSITLNEVTSTGSQKATGIFIITSQQVSTTYTSGGSDYTNQQYSYCKLEAADGGLYVYAYHAGVTTSNYGEKWIRLSLGFHDWDGIDA
jgi:hypothetical protein